MIMTLKLKFDLISPTYSILGVPNILNFVKNYVFDL